MLRRGTPLIAAVVFACCGDSLTVVMNAQNNSGEDGFATLTSRDSHTTRVYVQVRRPTTGEEIQDAHIHPGTCGEIGQVAWVLTSLAPPASAPDDLHAIPGDLKTGDDGGFLVSVTDVDAGFDQLTSGKWVINSHDEHDFAIYVSCGQIQK